MPGASGPEVPERAGPQRPRGWDPRRAELSVSKETAAPSNLAGVDRRPGAMDSESLLLSLELASGSGQGLSPDRRASLLTSLTLVKRDYRYSRVLFWGRILGLVADYYIAQGLSEDQLAPRKTLYRWRRRPSRPRRPPPARLLKGVSPGGREGVGPTGSRPRVMKSGETRQTGGRAGAETCCGGLGGQVLRKCGAGAGGKEERHLDAGGFIIQAGPRTEAEQGESSRRTGTCSRQVDA